MNMGFGENVKMFGAYGINTKAVLEGEVCVKQIINRAGGVFINRVVGSRMQVYSVGDGDARRKYGR